MGLLKGNNLRFTEAEAIVGADVFVPPDQDEASAVVPQAAPGEDGLAEDGAEWGDLDLGDNMDDLFAGGAELTGTVPEDAGPDWNAPVDEFGKVREQLIYGANEAANMDANEFGEQIQVAAGQLMTGAIEAAHADLLEANPAGDFDKVMPYVQRKVAVELDLELVGTVNEIRWTHLQRVEKQIVESAPDIARSLEANHPLEAFEELMARREEILAEARLEAERLMMEAATLSAETMSQAEQAQAATMMELEKEKERILAELRDQAYQEGYNEGKSAGEAEAAQYISEALQKLNEIAVAFPAAVKQNEEKLVTLSLEIAKKVIQEEIALQPEIVQRTVETALKRVSDLEQVVVKVNPLDLDLILPKQDTFKSLVPDVQSFSIEGSHTIQRGGCIIETNSGSINATIQAQLGIIEELFRNVRAEYEEDVIG